MKQKREPVLYKAVRIKADMTLLHNKPFEVVPDGSAAVQTLDMMKVLRDRLIETIDAIEKNKANKPWKLDRALVLDAWSFSLIRQPKKRPAKANPARAAERREAGRRG